jgi:hypothetical protein
MGGFIQDFDAIKFCHLVFVERFGNLLSHKTARMHRLHTYVGYYGCSPNDAYLMTLDLTMFHL